MVVAALAGVAEWVGITYAVYGSIINPASVEWESRRKVDLDNFLDPKFSLGRVNVLIYVDGVKEDY